MKAVVFGGRDYSDRGKVFRTLDSVSPPITCVVQGEAKGADSHAIAWAKQNRVLCMGYPAQWGTHGNAAGPIRNQEMIDKEHPDIAIAFPGGAGTADMIRRVRAANIPLTIVE